MMKRGLSRLTRRMLRRGQTGQTIVILAFGFIVLLGFVGIVTDVSLMFVRYSTLRRAIDAAAVSAAGQMRRAVPTPAEITQANAGGGTQQERDLRAVGYATARNITEVNLAARQFIELYGLTPTQVLVDTCATTEILPRTNPPRFSDPQLECETGEQPRKLVRVTAQVLSPTVFLRLLGWGTVTLEATAISETAVLDVVMIFDVSESMLNQTSYDDWDRVPDDDPTTSTETNQSMRYYPPRMTYLPNNAAVVDGVNSIGAYFSNDFNATWTTVLNQTQDQLNAFDISGNRIFIPKAFYVDDSGNPTTANYFTDARQPRQECRVRFFPASGSFAIPDGGNPALNPNPYIPSNDVRAELTSYMNTRLGISGAYAPTWDGFVPAYNYFGCCNDPSGNYQFYDLVCQPMQKVRSATEAFFNRIDFARGDRVALVTFDRSAYLVDPDGAGPQTSMIESQVNATDALRKSVGVRADPTYYADTDSDGDWDHFVLGGAAWSPSSADPNARLVKYIGTNPSFNGTALGGLNDYPVKDNCIFQNATQGYPRSLYSSPPDTAVPPMPPYYAPRYPNPLASAFAVGGTTVMHPDLNDPAWTLPADRKASQALYSYELRAACRGSNVGAALRVANNALLNPATVRLDNAVWVMVMLGDGAAAGSDPVRRNGLDLRAPQIYNGTNTSNPQVPPVPGDYGVYGVCPYGTVGDHDRAPLIGDNWERTFPYCSDKEPETRHFCFDPRTKDAAGNQYVDLAANPECEAKYDVDDFARDWADFMGLTDPFPALVTADQLGRENLQLPTIFTIGFGLDFQSGSGTCGDNPEDCLGEELLRYIADVGDNNRMDMDYQQDLRADGFLDKSLSFNEDWGQRGPCEGPVIGFSDPSLVPPAQLDAALVNPMAPKTNCGNYFNAPDEEELQNVFDTIASRMFTRLTR
jgi:hypothetical protein